MFSTPLLIAALSAFASIAGAENVSPSQHNIVFIIVDDLDARMTSPEIMPSLKKHVVDQGTTFSRHYCTVSLCCPARASILTGQNAHNHNVTNVTPPEGGWTKWNAGGYNDRSLPVFFQEAGYNTYYTGKLLNEITIYNFNNPYPAGWTGSEILVDPFGYDFFNAGLLHNQDNWTLYENQYSTDLIAKFSYDFLEDGVKAYQKKGTPFFIGMGPIAPHSQIIFTDITDPTSSELSPPVPAPRHAHMFPDAKVPREANFNPEKQSGAGWIRELPRLNESQIQHGDDWYRARLQSLQAVDEMVEEVFKRLERHNLLDDTYVVFTSDNGYHISQHRMPPGKTCGMEEDINVPLYIRGPGIPKGHVSEAVTAHIDLLPTFFKMAGIAQREEFDGSPIPLTQCDEKNAKTEHANIEMWMDAYGINSLPNEKRDILDIPAMAGVQPLHKRQSDELDVPADNTYKSVRLMGKDYNLYYSVWCTNEHELYDMETDFHQMHNLLPDGFNSTTEQLSKTLLGRDVEQVALRLDALLFVQKTCKGETCREPWEALMPGQGVSSLGDALDQSFDELFSSLPKVSFTACLGGYYTFAEGPQFEDWLAEQP